MDKKGTAVPPTHQTFDPNAYQFDTPMMQQFLELKRQYPDCILFFRLGDFYEMFLEDATVGADVLGITLTSRSRGKDGRVPMAGVPYHAVDSYLPKLVKAGYKVAICEQLTAPNGPDLVERGVVRIVTPGTLSDEKALDQKEPNFVCTFTVSPKSQPTEFGLALADLTTGQLLVTQQPTTSDLSAIWHHLTVLNPKECLLSPDLYDQPELLEKLVKFNITTFCHQSWQLQAKNAEPYLKKHLQTKSLQPFNLADKPLAQESAKVLLEYLRHTQQHDVSHMVKIEVLTNQDCLQLDAATISNLEILETIHQHQRQGSLLHLLDQTKTAMGGRLLRSWVLRPLQDLSEINHRQQIVSELVENDTFRAEVRSLLSKISDLDRLTSRLNVGLGTPRDLAQLRKSLQEVLQLHQAVTQQSGHVASVFSNLSTKPLKKIWSTLETKVVEDPPFDPRQGGIFLKGADPQLDSLLKTVDTSQEFLLNLEQRLKQETGISTLKVGYNKVFGFYIETSKAHHNAIPAHFHRKQTLVNAERYITEELKEHEDHILSAEAEQHSLELKLFLELVQNITAQTPLLQQTATQVATIDALASLAEVAVRYNYTKPQLHDGYQLQITAGRHPVVEQYVSRHSFVPNDILLDEKNQVAIITGPNMAGKSVLMRQVAIITLLAHLGSFVPASAAKIPVTDQIFVRSGAADNIAAGHSTFMVEMVETATILRQATNQSLIIMDEIGRGTSTYDGISIAWAVAQYLVEHPETKPKTLFATHYHELQQLTNHYPQQITNFHLAVTKHRGQLEFLYTVAEGGADHSFGLEVAKLAGLPPAVVTTAAEMLTTLFEQHSASHILPTHFDSKTSQSYLDTTTLQLAQDLFDIDINLLTPIDALTRLHELQKKYQKQLKYK